MSLAKDVSRALRWSAIGRLSAQLVAWVTTLIVIRLLSPEDYGLIALASSFLSFFSLICELGLGPTIIQAKDLTTVKIRELHGMVVISCVLIIASILFLSPYVSQFFHEPRLQLVLEVLSIQFVFAAFSIVPRNLLVRDLKYKSLGIIMLVAGIIASISTLLLALNGYGVWSLVFGTIIREVLSSSAVFVIARHWSIPLFRMANTLKEMQFGGGIIVQRMIWWLYSQLDIFIIGRRFSTEVLGTYSVAYNLASLPQQKLNAIINQISLSGLSKQQHDKNELLRHLQKAITFMMIVVVPVFFGISAVSGELVTTIIGEKWAAAVFPLTILPIMLPLRMAAAPIFEAVNAIGKPFVVVGNLLISLAVLGIALLVGTHWDLEGVCWAWTVATPLSFWINLHRIKKHIGFGPSEMFEAAWRPVTASFLMYASVSAVRPFISIEFEQLMQLVLLTMTGIVTYCIFIYLFARTSCRDLIKFARG